MTLDLVSWVSQQIDDDAHFDESAGLLVLAALDGDEALDSYLEGEDSPAVAEPAVEEADEPVGAFLKSIRVEGFRGIGQRCRWHSTPRPG
jgi:hypothetical protein